MATVTANVRPAFREKRHNSRTEGRYHTGITRYVNDIQFYSVFRYLFLSLVIVRP